MVPEVGGSSPLAHPIPTYWNRSARRSAATYFFRCRTNHSTALVSLARGTRYKAPLGCSTRPSAFASVQRQCVDVIRPGGHAVLVGLGAADSLLELPAARITRQEQTVSGCYYGTANPKQDFGTYAKWYQQGALPLDRLVSKTFALEQINQAYAEMLTGETARGLILL